MRILIFVTLWMCWAAIAPAQERHALVIGNADYATVRPLPSGVAGAELIADRLETLGFEVSVFMDANLVTMKRSIANFGRTMRTAPEGSVGLFYFAGHGMNAVGANYLLAVDSDISDAADLDFVALDVRSLLRQVSSGDTADSIVLLDCCGFNPFPDVVSSQSNGFTAMELPDRTALAFATAPGTVVRSEPEDASAFAVALDRGLEVPGATVREVLTAATEELARTTQNAQRPWFEGGSELALVLNSRDPGDPARPSEQSAWEALAGDGDLMGVMAFLQDYPDGRFADAAKRRLTELLSQDLAQDDPSQLARSQPASRTLNAPADAASDPGSESDMMARARDTGRPEDYRAYLSAYPDGVFVELARTELAAIEAATAVAAAAAPAQPNGGTEPARPDEADPLAGKPDPSEIRPDPATVAFESPLDVGASAITGKTIAQLIKTSPLFPPVAGLPESYWKNETCANCHKWTKDDLCTQANFYRTAAGEKNLGKQHPLGGSFKRNLRAWAEGGCK